MRQIDALKSPRFTQISTFARLPVTRDLADVRAAFVGIPFDDGTTYRTGARFGPSAIRQGSRLLRPFNPFVGTYPFDVLNAADYGDIDIIPGYIQDTMEIVQREMSGIIAGKRTVPYIGGGDHSITLPVLRAMHSEYGRVNLIHFDSHYDFWDSYWGKKYTHGTWLRRAAEEKLLKDIVQVGIRGSLFSQEDLEQPDRLGISSFNIRDVKYSPEKVLRHINALKGSTYISIDIDVVDPGTAPGTGTPEIGGFGGFEILEFLRGMRVDLAGFDVVEVSPPYDVSELTAMTAANLIYEMMSVQASGSERKQAGRKR
jgi:agmatinase